MAVNISRSQNAELDEGASDGRYRKARPDTTVTDLLGDGQTAANRASLHPFMNYGYLTQQYPSMQNPAR